MDGVKDQTISHFKTDISCSKSKHVKTLYRGEKNQAT